MHNHLPIRTSRSHDQTSREFFDHSSAQRINTDTVIVKALRAQYPQLHLTISPAYSCDLLSYAAAGHASARSILDNSDPELKWKFYVPPGRRLDGQPGFLADNVLFGKYEYTWKSHTFILYIVDGRDGDAGYPLVKNNYILSPSSHTNDELVLAASKYQDELHDEVWIFKDGFWQKSKELWDSVQKESWDDVILDKDMKKAIIGDVVRFFDSRETYAKLRVPWKRGIIYYGPPGNGKTISIKAMMNQLYKRKEPIPSLYVRSLAGFGGPERSISEIFNLARRTAPCYLIFEDLDSLIQPYVRSFFLNEVDGLTSNDGILMVGSTNHIDLLDPGIAKRPSRFDRKYFFSEPSMEQRISYCEFWRAKLKGNEDVAFPKDLCPAIAGITDGFSFAYIQEAFVAALLAIAARSSPSSTATPSPGTQKTLPEMWPQAETIGDYDHNSNKGQAGNDRTASGRQEALSDPAPARMPNVPTLWERAAAASSGADRPDLDKYVLWREIKVQVKNLRDELGNE